jgi:starch synthase
MSVPDVCFVWFLCCCAQVGSHPAIAGQTHKFMGIRNGIDTELWSPTENRFLPIPYDADTAEEGKRRWAAVLKVLCEDSC